MLPKLTTLDNLAVLLKPEILQSAWQLGRRIFASQRDAYTILDYHIQLDLKDSKGHRALYTKRMKVKFRQDNVFAYLDQAYGEGEIFADYKCSPGVPADRWRDGNRWWTLISLREIKSRGQGEEFFIERTIEDGFTESDVHLHTEITHPTQNLTINIIFPRKRSPRRIILIENNAKRTTELGGEYIQELPNNRQQLIWTTDKPRQFETYTIRWNW